MQVSIDSIIVYQNDPMYLCINATCIHGNRSSYFLRIMTTVSLCIHCHRLLPSCNFATVLDLPSCMSHVYMYAKPT